MKADIEIAQDAIMQPIGEIAAKVGLSQEDLELHGRYMAKVPLEVLRRLESREDGKLVLVTAITPTKAGEGKTVTSIGLMQALGKIGVKVMGALREPSMGPVFGLKGGATGGGRAQVYPMWEIDLHFTGDIHAVTSAHNLLSAMVENHLSKGNELKIDPTRIVWKKAIDMNCRELRDIVVGLGGRSVGGIPHESGFIITAASEISAILALTTSIEDLRRRLEKIVVAYDIMGNPVVAGQMKCVGAMVMLLKNAIKPNLVQTLEGQPVFVHGFPFANVAHGNNSLLATKYALKMADVVVTESGFASDLGAEKFFDIVCREGGLRPDCAVIVASVRALKMHGGACLADALTCEEADLAALRKGFANLDKHIQNVRSFGVPVVVALNHFKGDYPEEIQAVKEHCARANIPCALSDVYAHGGEGGRELAEMVMEVLRNEPSDFHYLYDTGLTIKEKIRKIATEMYGARDVRYIGTAERDIRAIELAGNDNLPVCMAKTQFSITDDPKLKGAPRNWTLNVKEVLVSAGAGFIIPLCGEIMLIPGLPSEPSAERMDYTNEGRFIGLS
ncbi:MAG: Formate--tetrahydrofolate ligase [Methanomassiliicoccales archaeon PtaU1.Bin030]|nr:MAG: Formate--tetrahydrofolate ligase [Methanomassiliicoccales archaeon PtaU1.Bin030]